MAHPLKGRTLPEDHSRKVAKAKSAERILAAARKLFARDGHKGATIRDIAAEAGMSTGAIFANYKNKSELYRAAHGHDPITPEQGRRLLEAQTMGASKNTPEFLLWIADRLVNVHGEDPNADFILSLQARAAAGACCINEIKTQETTS